MKRTPEKLNGMAQYAARYSPFGMDALKFNANGLHCLPHVQALRCRQATHVHDEKRGGGSAGRWMDCAVKNCTDCSVRCVFKNLARRMDTNVLKLMFVKKIWRLWRCTRFPARGARRRGGTGVPVLTAVGEKRREAWGAFAGDMAVALPLDAQAAAQLCLQRLGKDTR